MADCGILDDCNANCLYQGANPDDATPPSRLYFEPINGYNGKDDDGILHWETGPQEGRCGGQSSLTMLPGGKKVWIVEKDCAQDIGSKRCTGAPGLNANVYLEISNERDAFRQHASCSEGQFYLGLKIEGSVRISGHCNPDGESRFLVGYDDTCSPLCVA